MAEEEKWVAVEIPNPLRYPGSKAALGGYIALLLEVNLLSGCTIYEPYAGSAAVSLYLLANGFVERAVLVERDPLLYSFWKAVFSAPEALCDAVYKLDVSISTWKSMQHYRHVTDPAGLSVVELGLAGLFFNRTNYSGILGAGPIGGLNQDSDYDIRCRFEPETIAARILALSAFADRVDVVFGDALTFLRGAEADLMHSFSFSYIDPPYYAQGKRLYRYYYTDEEHARLAAYLLHQTYPWLVTYDDHPRIRELYKSSEMQAIYMDYCARVSRRGRELLISNLVIPPLAQRRSESAGRPGVATG